MNKIMKSPFERVALSGNNDRKIKEEVRSFIIDHSDNKNLFC